MALMLSSNTLHPLAAPTCRKVNHAGKKVDLSATVPKVSDRQGKE